MYLQLGFSLKVARLLVREQGIDSSERLKVLTDKNVDDICNVMRKQGSKSTDETLQRATVLCDSPGKPEASSLPIP